MSEKNFAGEGTEKNPTVELEKSELKKIGKNLMEFRSALISFESAYSNDSRLLSAIIFIAELL